jgi:hypothetical protein
MEKFLVSIITDLWVKKNPEQMNIYSLRFYNTELDAIFT